MRHHFGDRRAFLGVVDRRLEDPGQRKLAELFVQFAPPVDAARHADRQHPIFRDRKDARLFEFGLHCA